MTRKLLLACGIVSSVLYIVMTAWIPLGWPGYSSAAQTISELSAIDAPTRSLWVPLGTVYTLLLTAFGFGIWQVAGANIRLRTVAALLMVDGVAGLGWPPMHQRVVLAAGGGTITDTLHIAWSIATVLMMLLAIAFGATALGRRFRTYSILSLVVLVAFGLATFMDAPGIAANLATPWIGVWERINIAAFMVWVTVLACALLRRDAPVATVIHAHR